MVILAYLSERWYSLKGPEGDEHVHGSACQSPCKFSNGWNISFFIIIFLLYAIFIPFLYVNWFPEEILVVLIQQFYDQYNTDTVYLMK